jgi:hypothetical protein
LAQTPDTDQRVLQTLLSEVQQLRIAIERQTLLGTRTQIAINQLQLQESRAAAAAKELSTVRDEAAHAKEQKTNWTERLKDLEQKRSLVGATTTSARGDGGPDQGPEDDAGDVRRTRGEKSH